MAKGKRKREDENSNKSEQIEKKRKVESENSAKYERQKMLAAERQRKFKQRMTEEQLEKKRERDRERRRRLREAKVIKPISEMKASEQKKQRQLWKKYSAAYRNKQKNVCNVVENAPLESDNEVDNPLPIPRQQELGRKRVRRDRVKAYRTIGKQAEQIKNLSKALEKYKKRLQREKNKNKKNVSPSPAKQVRELVGQERVSPNIKRRLFVGFALENQLRTQMKRATPKGKERQVMVRVIGCKILKKYRVQTEFKKIVSYRYNKIQQENDSGQINLKYNRNQYNTLKVKEAQALKRFFEDDAVSKMCPGKKDFVRQGKLKMQRRILLNSMKNLYKRFLDESGINISYTTFARSRPFWVTFPRAKDRETCACIKHENFEFIITALKSANVIKEKNSTEVLNQIVCSQEKERCMLNLCTKCKSKMIEFNSSNEVNIKYFKWETITEDRNIKGHTKKVKRVVKTECYASESDIVCYFKSSLPLFKRHVFNWIHQANKLKKLKEKLKEGEILFHIDFSQNYVCKVASEIQSMHFGASKKQVSLHTVVRYHKGEKLKADSFCTASDNLDHHCHGVWAHLQPVLKESAEKFPDIHTVHIFSDGPSSQYKNKGNIYLMQTLLPTFFKNLKSFTWNYSEPGHGKGAMDGVGGSVKRCADDHVKYGGDITSAGDLVRSLQGHSSVSFAEVSDAEIKEMKLLLPTRLSVNKGIMQVRQLTCRDNKMYGRKLSCFKCKPSEVCEHHHLMELNTNQRTVCNTTTVKRTSVTSMPSKPSTSKTPSVSKKVLRVEDVYSSSEEELFPEVKDVESPIKLVPLDNVSKTTLELGTFVVVSFVSNVGKTKKLSRNFVGIVQSPAENSKDSEDKEVKVMFMKTFAKDSSLFFCDETDVPYVSCSQIISVLPTPTIVLKGRRVCYKFNKQIVL